MQVTQSDSSVCHTVALRLRALQMLNRIGRKISNSPVESERRETEVRCNPASPLSGTCTVEWRQDPKAPPKFQQDVDDPRPHVSPRGERVERHPVYRIGGALP